MNLARSSPLQLLILALQLLDRLFVQLCVSPHFFNLLLVESNFLLEFRAFILCDCAVGLAVDLTIFLALLLDQIEELLFVTGKIG